MAAFAIKAEICDSRAKTFALTAQRTTFGARHIAEGDTRLVTVGVTTVAAFSGKRPIVQLALNAEAASQL